MALPRFFELRLFIAAGLQPIREPTFPVTSGSSVMGCCMVGRDMRHLINLLDEVGALDVGLVKLGEGLDATTSAGRMAL